MSSAEIVVFAGTRDAEGLAICRETFADIERRYPGIPRQFTFASNKTRNILSDNGIEIMSSGVLANRLIGEGADEIIVRPILLSSGRLLNDAVGEIRDVAEGRATVRVLPVLLDSEHRIRAFAELVHLLQPPERQKNEPRLFLLHDRGNDSPDSLAVLLQDALRSLDPNVIVITLKKDMDISVVSDAFTRGNIFVSPLLLSHGIHTRRDLFGDEPQSLFSQLKHAGFNPIPDLPPLLTHPHLREFLIGNAGEKF